MAGPPPCELERRTGAGADGGGMRKGAGEAAPERVCVVVVDVRGREIPVLRCVGVRWCGCVGVRKSGGRLWRLAVGVVVMLLVLVLVLVLIWDGCWLRFGEWIGGGVCCWCGLVGRM
jgi:hypothetical protein